MKGSEKQSEEEEELCAGGDVEEMQSVKTAPSGAR